MAKLMYNWSTNKNALKGDAKKIWQLEQMINYGLNDRKISKRDLKKYWSKLTIDENKAKLLKLFINE